MSDERLRELERQWKESGTIRDEAAYLLEGVRAGRLEEERLRLAAFCGQEAARAALDEDPISELPSLQLLADELSKLDKHVRVRAVLAGARLVLERTQGSAEQQLLRQHVVALLSQWVEDPSEPLRQQLKEAGQELSSRQGPDSVFEYAAGAAWSRSRKSAWTSGALQFAAHELGEEVVANEIRRSLNSWALEFQFPRGSGSKPV